MNVTNIVCIGAGYVGGPTMAVIADRCPEVNVTVLDVDPQRIARWNSGSLPVFEPGLIEVVARTRGRNLSFQVMAPERLAEADLVFVCVNTPTKDYGEGAGLASDLQHWERSARMILASSKRGAIVVEKSTVPVRTAEAMSRILRGSGDGRQFAVLSNPEFLAEGTAIADLERPDRVLIGCEPSAEGRAAAEALAALYRRWVPRERVLLTNVWSSELAKLAANAMLAQRVSSINALSALCEKTEADVTELSRAIGMDSRVGARFLEAGVGFGGSCFRKDILSLVYICGQYGLDEPAAYWQAVVEINDFQMGRFVRNVLDAMFNTVAGKRLAVFGFAFKPDSNDTRDSPAIHICTRLLAERAHLVISDPQALDNARATLQGLAGTVAYEPDPYAAAQGAHAILLLTKWREYAGLDYRRIYAAMAKPAFFFDGRNAVNPDELHRIGFNVVPVGRRPMFHF
ncbi:MAG: nucleotide sugar dehydrogenase [Candidatus Lambdaproteobacteria bacterium]|nr:nucleotide sugar dehydrogenase [Candidatus Lambdaproteobacteria bacterium]